VYSEEDLLPVSALSQLVFCERRAALMLLERLWADNVFTAEGALLHEQSHYPTVECRREWRVVRGLWLHSFQLGLYGQADVVEFRRLSHKSANGVLLPGVDGWWQPFPVEFKRGSLRREASFEVQLCAQAVCLEEMLGAPVRYGALYYGKTRRRLELELSEELRDRTRAAAEHLHELVAARKTPRAVFRKKCLSCSLLELCLPTAMSPKKSVRKYLKQATEPRDETPS
jgi:CRISPR-associated exonuclease Cas4